MDVQRQQRRRRQVHFAAFSPLTLDGATRQTYIYRHAAGWLALLELKGASNQEEFYYPRMLPGLQDRLSGCDDLDFSIEMLDSQLSQIHSARLLAEVLGAVQQRGSTGAVEVRYYPPVTAIVGAARSDVSITLSSLAGVFDLPQISPSSTSNQLDNKQNHPRFARTVPNNQGDAIGIVRYLTHIDVTHVAVLYVADDYGTTFHNQILKVAAKDETDLDIVSFAFLPDFDGSLEDAVLDLKASQRRYVVAILNSVSWERTLHLAVAQEIFGVDGYAWTFTEGTSHLARDFTLNATLARALQGSGVLTMHIPPYEPFSQALLDFQQSIEQQEAYRQHVRNPENFMDDFNFSEPFQSRFYDQLHYDCVIALGIAACECPNKNFTGTELYNQLLKTEFDGVSGFVAFDHNTGTRQPVGILYAVHNIRLVNYEDEAAVEEGELALTSEATWIVDIRNHSVRRLAPFVHFGPSRIQPPSLPPLSANANLVPPATVGVGLGLCSLVLLLSLAFAFWALYNRSKIMVRQSQPIFLGQICVGTFLTASAIIPLALQEPVSQRGLDIACMCAPWLGSVGMGLAISALFSKIWRVNRLFRGAKILRRVTIEAKDAILPCIIWMTVTLSLLSAWTATAPLKWQRVPEENYDSFGRNKASVGRCASDLPGMVAGFLAPIVAVNVLALAMTNYQAYKARKISKDYSISPSIAFSSFCLLQTFLIGTPLLFLSHANPTASFLVRAIILSVSCLSILLPIFIPRMIRHADREYTASMMFEAQGSSSRHWHMDFKTSDSRDNKVPSATYGVTRVTRRSYYEAQRGRDPTLQKPRSSGASEESHQVDFVKAEDDHPPQGGPLFAVRRSTGSTRTELTGTTKPHSGSRTSGSNSASRTSSRSFPSIEGIDWLPRSTRSRPSLATSVEETKMPDE